MNDPTPNPLALLDEYFDGRLTKEQADQLRDFINANPQNAEQVILAAFVHRNLRDIIGGREDLENDYLQSHTLNDAQILPAVHEIAEASPSFLLADPFVANVPPPRAPRRLFRTSRRVFAVAAAVIVIASALLFFLHGAAKPATITALVDAHSPSPIALHQQLSAGPFTLSSGLAQITFTNGASVILQGPASIAIDSPSSLRLLAGKLTTHVPPSAVGFTVHAPNASIVDLGTEVGIHVQADNQTHIEVFTGRAQVQLPDAATVTAANTRILTRSTAVNVSANAEVILDAAPQPLSFILPAQLENRPQVASTPFTRWQSFSKQLSQDPSLLAYYPCDSSTSSDLPNRSAATLGLSNGLFDKASWLPGRFPEKSAVHFDADFSCVNVDIPGELHQFTFAAWVNMRSFKNSYVGLLLANGTPNGIFPHWQCIRKPYNAIVIELGVEKFSDRLSWQNFQFPADILGQDLGHWHLLATSCDLPHHVVTCWIDGKCVGSKPMARDSSPVTIGRAEIGNWRSSKSGNTRGLDGEIDELAVWNRSLTTEEIQAMYTAGAPQ